MKLAKLITVLPVLVFFTETVLAADIYVDKNSANSEEDGSEANPYHTLASALVKTASNPENNRQIYVKAGNYQEEITLPDNSILTGENKDTVIINRENLEGSTVTAGKNSVIENVTIRGGNYGLTIPAYKKSVIRNCKIEETKRIGIWIKHSNKLPDNGVEIWDSIIANNARKGLYGESRYLYFLNNRFEDNGEEGIDLRSKINGVLSNNIISNNGEGGIETEIRKVVLEISGNTLSQNQSNGITLNNRTNVGGKVIIKNNTLSGNHKYGIRCAGSKNWTNKLWKKSVNNSHNSFSGNIKRDISKSCGRK
ncbi:MAG: right-handed parallel beta-helix repeat-containing protein [Candidatus Moranbacteria bacterium]|nr:right-handed parallel beta-helix repeat-containing protein [Candidatus Moranbacteria bacterium]